MTILFNNEARNKLLKGLYTVCEAVSGTIGPLGKNVFIERPYQNLITNDGVTVANSIELEDKFENMGASVVKNATAKTNDDVGDGTSTTAVLLQAVIEEALQRPENPMEVRISLQEAGRKVLELLKEKSVKIEKKDVYSVALVSSEHEELARTIAELVNEVGEQGVITVEDSKTFETSAEIVNGYDVPTGLLSPYFVTDKTGKAVLEDVYVLVSEKRIGTFADLQPIAKQFQDKGVSQCVIVADDIDDSIVGLFAANTKKGIFKSIVIRAHGEVLEDIEGVTGAKAVSDKNGITFQNLKLEHLGKVDKVVSDFNKTIFFGDNVSATIRASELDTMAENEPNQYRKEKIKDRAAKLRGSVGIIKVGASTDYERDYLKLKAEDAVKAVQAALQEGVVEGGGIALWRVAKKLDGSSIGEQILCKVLQAPFKKIIENGGDNYVRIVSGLDDNTGWDAKEKVFINMLENGIIDPYKVVRMAFENALSAASTFITSFAAIIMLEKK